jgi:hypothetical protein
MILVDMCCKYATITHTGDTVTYDNHPYQNACSRELS